MGADGVATIAGLNVGRRSQDIVLPLGLLAVVGEGRMQQPTVGELAEQQDTAGLLVQSLIVGTHTGTLQELGDHTGVDGRVLPQVQASQVKAEDFHGADQVGQRTAGKGLTVASQQTVQHDLQVGTQRVGTVIGFGWPGGGPCGWLPSKVRIGRRQPRIYVRQRPPIGLVCPLGRQVWRGVGQGLELRRHFGQARRDRQLSTQRMDLVEIHPQGRARLTGHRLTHYRLGDKGIAIAVAPDPGSDPKERR